MSIRGLLNWAERWSVLQHLHMFDKASSLSLSLAVVTTSCRVRSASSLTLLCLSLHLSRCCHTACYRCSVSFTLCTCSLLSTQHATLPVVPQLYWLSLLAVTHTHCCDHVGSACIQHAGFLADIRTISNINIGDTHSCDHCFFIVNAGYVCISPGCFWIHLRNEMLFHHWLLKVVGWTEQVHYRSVHAHCHGCAFSVVKMCCQSID